MLTVKKKKETPPAMELSKAILKCYSQPTFAKSFEDHLRQSYEQIWIEQGSVEHKDDKNWWWKQFVKVGDEIVEYFHSAFQNRPQHLHLLLNSTENSLSTSLESKEVKKNTNDDDNPDEKNLTMEIENNNNEEEEEKVQGLSRYEIEIMCENRLFRFDSQKQSLIVIGRRSICDIQVTNEKVSRVAAIIYLLPHLKQMLVVDVGSTSGMKIVDLPS